MKLTRLAALLLLCLFLASCAVARQEEVVPMVTLPPALDDVVAPVGDAALSVTETVALYLPSQDGQRLTCQYETIVLNQGRHPAEAVARALLAHPGNEAVSSLGRGVALQLSTSNPIELSGNVCTVNLMPSALQLDHADLYTTCLCLATTLCELKDIQVVNVLVAGQAIALDVANRLPLGCLSAHVGAELPGLWSQMTARRVPVGGDPSTVPLTAAATLYYPLADGNGVIPEVRTLSFPGQEPVQLVEGLLTALSVSPLYRQDASALPPLDALMSAPPAVTDLETGGRMVTLRFNPSLEVALLAEGVDTAGFVAALTCTLTTFVPSLSTVQCYVGDQPLTNAYSPSMGSQLYPGGVMRRTDFAAFIRAQATIYLPRGDKLMAVTRRLADEEAYHPRTLLLSMIAGPTAYERATGFSALMPEEITDADILGLSVAGDTLLVNFSGRAAERISASGLDQRLMCRGMVSALCELMRVRRVRFFFDGDAVQTLNGPIFWGGEFLYSPALTDAAGGA